MPGRLTPGALWRDRSPWAPSPGTVEQIVRDDDTQRQLQAELVTRLAGIDFARRYYEFYERHPLGGQRPALGQAGYQAAIDRLPMEFTYHRRERFFGTVEWHGETAVGLNVAFSESRVELILTVQVGGVRFGGPFPLLARQVAQLDNPAFAYEPRSPKLPFRDEAGLHEAVEFGAALFEDARRAILGAPWPDPDAGR
jgi:hypothetical protein